MAGMVAKSVATLGARSQPQNGLFVNRFHLEQGVAVNLAASRRFVTWLWQQPEFQQSAHYSAKRVTQILYFLTEKYNSQWNHI